MITLVAFALFCLKPQIEGYKEKITNINYDLGIIIEEEWVDSVYLGVSQVTLLPNYLSSLVRKAILEQWLAKSKKKMEERGKEERFEGIIPELKIPGLEEQTSINIRGSNQISIGMGGSFHEGVKSGFSPQPQMNQNLNVGVDGIIAKKTKIQIDHSSGREIQAENTVKLSYEGDEDEIVEYIRAGDISLAMPTNVFARGLPAHKGLFGLSTKLKLGPIDVYGVASKEEAQTETKEIKGTLRERVDTIYNFNFQKNKYFRILNEPLRMLLGRDDTIIGVGLYVLEPGRPVPDDRKPAHKMIASPYAHLYPEIKPSNEQKEVRYAETWYSLIRNKDYYFYKESGVIEILSPFSEGSYWLAAACTTSQGTPLWRESGDTIFLLLIWPQYPDSSLITWDNELRNFYYIGTGIDMVNLEVEILRIDPGRDVNRETEGPKKGELFTKILGIDPEGKGRVSANVFDPVRGVLIFPSSEPFNDTLLSVRDSSIYLTRTPKEHKYKMVFKYPEAAEFNISPFTKEGSVRVQIDGEWLKEGTDFRVDYTNYKVIINRPISPGADIRITYEYLPIFATKEGAVAGIRVETKAGKIGKFGGNLLYRSEGERGIMKPVLGQEPYNRTIAALDFNIDKELTELTHLIDRLPLISSTTPSKIYAEGNLGLSVPNPNVLGIVFVEDFEGTKESDGLIVTERWYPPSLPANKDTSSYSKKVPVWKPISINRKTIFGEASGDITHDIAHILRIIYNPESPDKWSGIMTTAGRTALDISQKDNLEIIFHSTSSEGILHFNFGSSLDEDQLRLNKSRNIVGWGKYDREDKNHNYRMDQGEDTGLDGVMGEDPKFPSIKEDDGNDDYNFDTNPMGTERNNILDDEDINRDGWNKINNYYEVSVNLSLPNKFIKELKNGWKMLKIPLSDTTLIRTYGNPDKKLISHFRLWFEGMKADTIRLYSWEFSGTAWRDLSIYREDSLAPEVDTTFEKAWVSVVNRQIDPSYTSPFRLRRGPRGEYELDNSLQIEYENIRKGHAVKVNRYMTRGLDFRGYKELGIYVHADTEIEKNSCFIFRFGADSLNYYEYRARIKDGKPVVEGKGWFEFTVSLSDFTSAKVDSYFTENIKFRGMPSLANIKFYSLCLYNPGESEVTGKIWFNDIRLVSPWKEKGFSFQGSTTLTLADIGRLHFSISRNDPNFVSFTEAPGVKTSGLSNATAISAGLDLDKIFPLRRLGIKLPFSFSRVQSRAIPKFSPIHNDYKLPAEEAKKITDNTIKRSFTSSLTKERSKNLILRYTVDAISFRLDGSETHNQRNTGRNLDSTKILTSSISYDITPQAFLKVWKKKLYLLPHSISFSASPSYRYTKRLQRDSLNSPFTSVTKDEKKEVSTKTSFQYHPLDRYILTSVTFNANRDLKTPSEFKGVNIGERVTRDITLNNSLSGISFGRFGTPTAGVSSRFQENYRTEVRRDTNARDISNGGRLDMGISNINIGKIVELGSKFFSKKDPIPGSPPWLFAKLQEFTQKLNPVSINYSYNRNSTYYGYLREPDYEYILGINDSIPQADYINAGSRARTQTISGSTGFKEGNFSLGVNLQQSLSKNLTFGIENFTLRRDLPKLDLTLSGVEKYIQKLTDQIQTASLTSSMVRTLGFSGTIRDTLGKEKLDTNNVNNDINFSPLLSLKTTWKNRLSATLSSNYQKSVTKNYGAFRDAIITTRSLGGNIELNYTFRAPEGLKIPWLKHIRIKNDLGVATKVGYTKNHGTSIQIKEDKEPTEPDVTRNESVFNLNISASYNFSQTFDGGAMFTFTKRSDHLNPNMGYKTFNLNAFVTIHF